MCPLTVALSARLPSRAGPAAVRAKDVSGWPRERVLGMAGILDTARFRTFIAWEPDNMAEVVRIVADIGSSEVEAGVPDVMTGLPAGEAPAGGETPPEPGDSAGGGGGNSYPGFIGEYLVRDVGSWWAVEGSQSNALLGSAGACTDDRVTFDWAEFACEAKRPLIQS